MTDPTTITVREALRQAMHDAMLADADVFIMGEEVAEYQGAYKVTQGLWQTFGSQRVIDTPITEHGFAGLAVGSALAGLKPIVEFMTFNFAMQAIDHIINSAAKTLYMSGGKVSCPIVFRGPNGSAARVGAQHSQHYGSWYSHIPGLKVVAPYSAEDHYRLLRAAIADPNPVIVLEHELLYGQSFRAFSTHDWSCHDRRDQIGKAEIIRPGTDVTITAFSLQTALAIEAADALAERGISAEIIDLRSLRPLDVPTIMASLAHTHRLVSVEEGWPQSGIGAEIAALVMEHGFDLLDAPVVRVTAKDTPLPYAANLERLALPSVEEVIAACSHTMYRT